ncbi:tyrosine-protein phosphatase [Nocardia sp. NPDC005978]|uniref:tyrosine-protein phosphatase n=1 Tax=unclassified Nocardia TaxID=2637762 RepID=UPI00339DF6B8
MTISRAVRGTLTGVAAALIAVLPATATPALSAPNVSILQQAPVSAAFSLQTAPNARDIGGLVATGGKVKSGLVYRTDALNKLTEADQQTLISAGVTKVIDFRAPSESSSAPDKLPASIPGVAYPIWDPNNDFYTFFATIIAGGPDVQADKLGNGKNVQYMADYYRWMVTDATARAQLSAALKDIANADGAVLYHCTAGKDRTGVMTATLLSILGTPQNQIYGNFLESNDRLAATNKATLDYLVSSGRVTDRTLFEPLLGVQKEFLDAFMNQAVASYGSFPVFVSNGLGIDDATFKKITGRLIDKGGNTGSFGTGSF